MQWNIVIGAVCAIVGALFSYAAFARNKRSDAVSEGSRNGEVMAELGYIKSSVDNINRKLDVQEERNMEFASRLSAVEASAKQAHHRIDRLEGREAKGE